MAGQKKYKKEYKYNTFAGMGTASIAIEDDKIYTIEDLTLGNAKNYVRFRKEIEAGKYGDIIPIAIVYSEERARKEAEKLGYIPHALFYTIDKGRIIAVLPDKVVEKDVLLI